MKTKSPTKALLDDIRQLESSLEQTKGQKESKDTWVRLLSCLSIPDVIMSEFQTSQGDTYSHYTEVISENTDCDQNKANLVYKLRCSLSHNYLVSQPLRSGEPTFSLYPHADHMIQQIDSAKYRINNRMLCRTLEKLAENVLRDFDDGNIGRRSEAKLLRLTEEPDD